MFINYVNKIDITEFVRDAVKKSVVKYWETLIAMLFLMGVFLGVGIAGIFDKVPRALAMLNLVFVVMVYAVLSPQVSATYHMMKHKDSDFRLYKVRLDVLKNCKATLYMNNEVCRFLYCLVLAYGGLMYIYVSPQTPGDKCNVFISFEDRRIDPTYIFRVECPLGVHPNCVLEVTNDGLRIVRKETIEVEDTLPKEEEVPESDS